MSTSTSVTNEVMAITPSPTKAYAGVQVGISHAIHTVIDSLKGHAVDALDLEIEILSSSHADTHHFIKDAIVAELASEEFDDDTIRNIKTAVVWEVQEHIEQQLCDPDLAATSQVRITQLIKTVTADIRAVKVDDHGSTTVDRAGCRIKLRDRQVLAELDHIVEAAARSVDGDSEPEQAMMDED